MYKKYDEFMFEYKAEKKPVISKRAKEWILDILNSEISVIPDKKIGNLVNKVNKESNNMADLKELIIYLKYRFSDEIDHDPKIGDILKYDRNTRLPGLVDIINNLYDYLF